ncbi:hypothetical protein [Streptomyces sp. AC495_CC817]|uniref:hypothetical protein n=1 Tax=Streptomyces sp. AC495_CC817 TaxID=2823900 RepID=UPI001C27D912|nr:hypothetical protein [Streptomyces sp. AC495_CC817]
MELLKAAKARIDTPIRVIPVEGAYGSPGRILSFGSPPPFLAKVVPIRPENVDNVASIEAALRWWLDPWSDERQFDEAWLMSQWMGCEVRLVAEEDHTGKVAFR